MTINTGAAHLFARPILYNGVQYLAGDRVPPSVSEKKLRGMMAANHVKVGVAPVAAPTPVPIASAVKPPVESVQAKK